MCVGKSDILIEIHFRCLWQVARMDKRHFITSHIRKTRIYPFLSKKRHSSTHLAVQR